MRKVMADDVTVIFENMADCYADRLAIVSDKSKWTYSDLNRRANAVADLLIARAGTGNVPVALLFSHSSAELIAAMIGTLKAGKVCAIINPHPETKAWGNRSYTPNNYIQSFLDRLDPLVVLCDQANWALALEVSGRRKVINVDLPFTACESNPQIAINLTDLSFILHTTGTQGEHKAVSRTHALESYVQAIGNEPPTVAGDRSTLFRTASTGAIHDAFFALLNGATLCLYDLTEPDLGRLTNWMVENKVTVFRGVGTAFRNLDFERGEGFPDLRLVNIGGELITDADRLLCKTWCSNAQFVARYAASEIGTIAQGPTSGALTAVGDRTILIRDGEIVVDSAYTAEGYFGKDELTARKFKDLGNGRRRFFTSDRGYLREDGRLVHQGRPRKAAIRCENTQERGGIYA